LYGLSFGEYLRYRDERLFRIYSNNHKIFRCLMENEHRPPEFNKNALKEINKELNAYVIYGSYPEVAKHDSDQDKVEIIKNIYITYIGRDVTGLLGITDSLAFRKVLSLLSLQIGSLLNYNELANESQTYYKQVIGYISALEETYIVKLLKPFHKNLRTELRKNPKVYLLDSGLRNYISNDFNGLDNRNDAGHLVENFVFNQLHGILQPNQQLNFWRTLGKAEVDFVFSTGREVIPIEVKFSPMKKPEINKGMNSFIEKYKPRSAIVATKDFSGKIRVGKTVVHFIPVAFI
jgi:predicted AAA+ superfamily ATPase